MLIHEIRTESKSIYNFHFTIRKQLLYRSSIPIFYVRLTVLSSVNIFPCRYSKYRNGNKQKSNREALTFNYIVKHESALWNICLTMFLGGNVMRLMFSFWDFEKYVNDLVDIRFQMHIFFKLLDILRVISELILHILMNFRKQRNFLS